VALAAGKKVTGATTWSGGEKKVALQAQFLKPIPVTSKNLDLVVKAGWIKKEDLCKGVEAATAPAACK
jgi:D-xylose transport system substrate-binding protein